LQRGAVAKQPRLPTFQHRGEIAMYKPCTSILLLALSITACAQLPDQSSEGSAERVYRTGSNLPVHERTSTGKVLSLDRDATEDLIRRSQQAPMPTPTKAAN
jgi:hypothetical protein